MSKCECLTAKGKQCKLYASKKQNTNRHFCWLHQNCQQVAKISLEKENIVLDDKEYNWCKFPAVIRANIIKDLSREDVNRACLVNKDCAKMCKNNDFWKNLVRVNYGKDIPVGKNVRQYYYDLFINAYIVGDYDSTIFNFSENVDKSTFIEVMDSVIHVATNGDIYLFLTVDDKVYGKLGENEIELLHENIKMIWVNSLYIDEYYILDNDRTLYSVRQGNQQLLMRNVLSIIVSDNMIYANDKAIDTNRGRRVIGDLRVEIENGIVKYRVKGEPLNVVKFYEVHDTICLIDKDNILYTNNLDKIYKLSDNSYTVGIMQRNVFNIYGPGIDGIIYWNSGHILYRKYKKEYKEWKLDSNIKTICCGLEVCFILTDKGHLYMHANLNILQDLTPEKIFIQLLPENVKLDPFGDMLKPALIKSNVREISFGKNVLLAVI